MRSGDGGTVGTLLLTEQAERSDQQGGHEHLEQQAQSHETYDERERREFRAASPSLRL